nr:MAG TPA: hypothetical protein [Bacteriophage sp.]
MWTQTASRIQAELSTGPGKTLSAMLFPPLRRFEADFNTVYAPRPRL